jgi:hypothetical protein
MLNRPAASFPVLIVLNELTCNCPQDCDETVYFKELSRGKTHISTNSVSKQAILRIRFRFLIFIRISFLYLFAKFQDYSQKSRIPI